jgi:alpha-L-arabinofuranosidase
MLYSQHHGDRLLAMETAGVPTYAQPYRMGRLEPQAKVASLDGLATTDENKIYIHVINRDFKRDLPVTIDVSGLGPMGKKADVYRLEGRLNNIPKKGESLQVGRIEHSQLVYDGKGLKATLSARSVTCIEFAPEAVGVSLFSTRSRTESACRPLAGGSIMHP